MAGVSIGMLWRDNSTDPLAQKVERAKEYYQRKYGVEPTVCYIHPSMMEGTTGRAIMGMELSPARTIFVDHFWIGMALDGDGAKKPEMAAAPKRSRRQRRH